MAALVAYCNATASAQLAAQYPTSGGTYIYGRERLGPWWGFLAGWGFVIGKIASCAAMALTFAAYVAPGPWERPVAIAAVIILATVNYHGITRTAALTKIIVAVVLATLALVVAASLSGSRYDVGSVLGSLGRRLVRHLAVGWPAVLRVCRLRPDRNHGRRGPRPGTHYSPGDLDRSHHHRVDLLSVAASILVVLGPAGVAAARHRWPRRWMRLVGCGPACRSGWGRRPQRSAPCSR